jgi:predicted deacylase
MYVNGAGDGDHLCVLAGMHATEYPSIDGAIQVYRKLDPSELSGKVTIVPVLNPAAFWTRTPYVNPQDGVDIGSTFGEEGDSISYLISDAIENHVLPDVDMVVDLHGGDLIEDIVPHAGYAKTSDEQKDSTAREMAEFFGTRFVFERLGKDATDVFGVPRVIGEAGREGKLEPEHTQIHIDGVMNILKGFDMLDDEPECPDEQQTLHGRYELFCEASGMFESHVGVGDRVEEGEILGEIRNLRGEVVEEIIAPEPSVVQLITTNPVKHEDDIVFKCWFAPTG